MNSEAHSVNLNAMKEQKEVVYDRVTQRLVDIMAHQPEKKFGIERLKALGATEFTGTTKPEEFEKWIRTLEKCFRVMQCPQDIKEVLAVFLLQRDKDW